MSGYFWDDRFFEDKEGFEETRALMNDCLHTVVGKYREYAIYRFGLEGRKEHLLHETAEHFSITTARVRSLDCSIMRTMGIRMPTIRSRSTRVKEFLESL